MLPHALTNFEMQKCYQSEPKFNSVFSRNNLPKIKEWTYLINLDKYKSIEMHCIVFYLNGENVLYICSFGVQHFPKQTKKFVGDKNVATNIYRIQTKSRYVCTEFVNFMLKGKILLDYTNIFSPK